jgi:hypothetical protein
MIVPESEMIVPESEMIVPESEMTVPESEMTVPESEMIVFESNTDIFVCRLVLYSSIAYGLLRDGAVCSGLPVEPAPNAPCAGFLGAFLRAALRLRLFKRIWGNQFPQTPNQCDVCSARAPSNSAEAPLLGCD